MQKKMLLACVVLFLFSCSMFSEAFAQSRIPGVSTGDVFTYTKTVFWSSSDPTATIPQNLTDINMTAWYRVLVTEVSGSNVSIYNLQFFTDGNQTSSNGIVDVDTGLNYGGDFWMIIGANLSAGDVLHPLGGDLLMINETVPMRYANATRDTNHVNWMYEATTGSPQTETFDAFFDRTTGMLVLLNDTTSTTNPNTTYSIVWSLEASSAWVVPEFSSFIAVPILIIAALIGTLFYRQRFLKKRKETKS